MLAAIELYHTFLTNKSPHSVLWKKVVVDGEEMNNKMTFLAKCLYKQSLGEIHKHLWDILCLGWRPDVPHTDLRVVRELSVSCLRDLTTK